MKKALIFIGETIFFISIPYLIGRASLGWNELVGEPFGWQFAAWCAGVFLCILIGVLSFVMWIIADKVTRYLSD